MATHNEPRERSVERDGNVPKNSNCEEKTLFATSCSSVVGGGSHRLERERKMSNLLNSCVAFFLEIFRRIRSLID